MILQIASVVILLMIYGSEHFSSYALIKGRADLFFLIPFPILFMILCWRFWCATPGKLICGLQVVDSVTGERLAWWQVILRCFGYLISAIPLFFGFIRVAFDPRRQGFHDQIARSLVVEREVKDSADGQRYSSLPIASQHGALGFWDAPRAYWVCQSIGWGISVGNSWFGRSGWEIIVGLPVLGTGLLLTHVLRYVIRRQDWLSFPKTKYLPRLFLSAVVIGVLMTGLNVALTIVLKQFGIFPKPSFDPTHWENALSDVVGLAILIGIWQALYFLICRYQRREIVHWRLEGDLATAELRALKAQLNPHFLFNCLNGLRALIVEDPERAQHVVTRLASVLRYSLQSSSTPTVSLECELQTVDDYLELEAIRFEERLRVRRQIDPATLTTQVPPMVVQTLVENAVKYGVSKSPEPGEIVITSSLTNEGAVITVANTGQIEPRSDSTGLGLANATDRLRRLFGPAASISLEQSSPEVVTATIRLPRARVIALTTIRRPAPTPPGTTAPS